MDVRIVGPIIVLVAACIVVAAITWSEISWHRARKRLVPEPATWWSGPGKPLMDMGAKEGDVYVDRLTSKAYRLRGNTWTEIHPSPMR